MKFSNKNKKVKLLEGINILVGQKGTKNEATQRFISTNHGMPCVIPRVVKTLLPPIYDIGYRDEEH